MDFDDFFLFADVFTLREGEEGYNPVFDMDGSGIVDFDDFFLFADNFGRRSSRAAGKPTGIASPVSYEDAPQGRMSEESFRAAWDALHERLNMPEPAGKALQDSEPEYRFHVQSLESPPAFAAFDVIIKGSFPAPGEPPREIVVTPAGPVTSITRAFFVSPQDTTVAYGQSAVARGLLTVLYDGVPSLVQAVSPAPASRDTVANADGTFRVVARFSYEGLAAVQAITVLAPPPPPDTTPPTIAIQFLAGNARLRVTVSDNRASQLLVSITVAGRVVSESALQEAGTPADYNTGLVYDEATPWRTSAVSIQASDGLNEAALDTAVALEDMVPPAVTIADGGSMAPDGRVSLSFTADEDQSGVSRSAPAVSVMARFPDGTEAAGTYSSLSRYGVAGVSGTVASSFGSPNTGSPRNVQVFVRVADGVGNTGEASVTLRQNTASTSSPATGGGGGGGGGGSSGSSGGSSGGGGGDTTPPPTNVAPSLSGASATVGGNPISGAISANTAVTFSVSASGTPSPTVTWEGQRNGGAWETLGTGSTMSRTFPSAGIWNVRANASNGTNPDASTTVLTNQVVLGSP
ncbi:MAG: hypothetical protein HYW81_01745 [Parcubacteria group bacterium]|nr:hypothetical protein [Parcubacteria group bacterium]